MLTEKILVGIEGRCPKSEIRELIQGKNSVNLKYIQDEGNCVLSLRGKGSGFIEQCTGLEASQPLHVFVTFPSEKTRSIGEKLILDLIKTTYDDLEKKYGKGSVWCKEPKITEVTGRNDFPKDVKDILSDSKPDLVSTVKKADEKDFGNKIPSMVRSSQFSQKPGPSTNISWTEKAKNLEPVLGDKQPPSYAAQTNPVVYNYDVGMNTQSSMYNYNASTYSHGAYGYNPWPQQQWGSISSVPSPYNPPAYNIPKAPEAPTLSHGVGYTYSQPQYDSGKDSKSFIIDSILSKGAEGVKKMTDTKKSPRRGRSPSEGHRKGRAGDSEARRSRSMERSSRDHRSRSRGHRSRGRRSRSNHGDERRRNRDHYRQVSPTSQSKSREHRERSLERAVSPAKPKRSEKRPAADVIEISDTESSSSSREKGGPSKRSKRRSLSPYYKKKSEHLRPKAKEKPGKVDDNHRPHEVAFDEPSKSVTYKRDVQYLSKPEIKDNATVQYDRHLEEKKIMKIHESFGLKNAESYEKCHKQDAGCWPQIERGAARNTSPRTDAHYKSQKMDHVKMIEKEPMLMQKGHRLVQSLNDKPDYRNEHISQSSPKVHQKEDRYGRLRSPCRLKISGTRDISRETYASHLPLEEHGYVKKGQLNDHPSQKIGYEEKQSSRSKYSEQYINPTSPEMEVPPAPKIDHDIRHLERYSKKDSPKQWREPSHEMYRKIERSRKRMVSPAQEIKQVQKRRISPDVSQQFQKKDVRRGSVSPHIRRSSISPHVRKSNMLPHVKGANMSPHIKRTSVSPHVRRINVPSPVRRANMSPHVGRSNASPHVRRSNASPHVGRSNVSPHVRRANVSPHVRRSNVSPHVRRANVSPHVRRANVSPHVRRSNVSPHVRRASISPHMKRADASPHRRANVSPGIRKYSTSPHTERQRRPEVHASRRVEQEFLPKNDTHFSPTIDEPVRKRSALPVPERKHRYERPSEDIQRRERSFNEQKSKRAQLEAENSQFRGKHVYECGGTILIEDRPLDSPRRRRVPDCRQLLEDKRLRPPGPSGIMDSDCRELLEDKRSRPLEPSRVIDHRTAPQPLMSFSVSPETHRRPPSPHTVSYRSRSPYDPRPVLHNDRMTPPRDHRSASLQLQVCDIRLEPSHMGQYSPEIDIRSRTPSPLLEHEELVHEEVPFVSGDELIDQEMEQHEGFPEERRSRSPNSPPPNWRKMAERSPLSRKYRNDYDDSWERQSPYNDRMHKPTFTNSRRGSFQRTRSSFRGRPSRPYVGNIGSGTRYQRDTYNTRGSYRSPSRARRGRGMMSHSEFIQLQEREFLVNFRA